MDTKQPTAYVICGFIGAGKTTFAKNLEKETHAIRITKDEWMVQVFGNTVTSDANFETYDNHITTLARDMAFKILTAGNDVIIDEGFWAKTERNDMRKKILDVGATPVFYYVECPMEKMRKRVLNRSNNPPADAFEISGELFDSYIKFWETPDDSEDVLIIRSPKE